MRMRWSDKLAAISGNDLWFTHATPRCAVCYYALEKHVKANYHCYSKNCFSEVYSINLHADDARTYGSFSYNLSFSHISLIFCERFRTELLQNMLEDHFRFTIMIAGLNTQYSAIFLSREFLLFGETRLMILLKRRSNNKMNHDSISTLNIN